MISRSDLDPDTQQVLQDAGLLAKIVGGDKALEEALLTLLVVELTRINRNLDWIGRILRKDEDVYND